MWRQKPACDPARGCAQRLTHRRGVRLLTLRELNRATLARQLLLARRPVSVTKALERTGGLQAQWPPSPYLGLWTRVEGFRADDLVRAVARRRVVKATLMRATLHLVSAPSSNSPCWRLGDETVDPRPDGQPERRPRRLQDQR